MERLTLKKKLEEMLDSCSKTETDEILKQSENQIKKSLNS